MNVAVRENRHHFRYKSSQKAVLRAADGSRRFCIVRNVSNGGLCVAIVGSPGPARLGRVEVEVKRGSIPCDIVSSDGTGLHCRFADPIDEPDLWRLLPPAGTAIAGVLGAPGRGA